MTFNNQHKLYGNGAFGTNVWEIWSIDNIIHIHANGGAYTEEILEGKGGRTLAQQVELRVNARVRGKLDGGFKLNKEELLLGNTNQLGLVMPMLASPSKGRFIPYRTGVFIQPKLDGHRCLINSNEAYSRRGKIIDTIPEIQNSLNIEKGLTLDGELYCHGEPLQTIASWAKRRQKNTLKLKFHIYDVIGMDENYAQRLAYIQSLDLGLEQFATIVDTRLIYSEEETEEHFSWAKQSGYEGSIIRIPNSKYLVGKRSKELLKVKKRHDAEFKCIDVIPSREGLGILVLETEEGKHFKTLAPGDNYIKKKTLETKENYIGKYVTCEYAERTKDNIPFHNVAMRWRKDL